jgi:hypothetical protein
MRFFIKFIFTVILVIVCLYLLILSSPFFIKRIDAWIVQSRFSNYLSSHDMPMEMTCPPLGNRIQHRLFHLSAAELAKLSEVLHLAPEVKRPQHHWDREAINSPCTMPEGTWAYPEDKDIILYHSLDAQKKMRILSGSGSN